MSPAAPLEIHRDEQNETHSPPRNVPVQITTCEDLIVSPDSEESNKLVSGNSIALELGRHRT